MFVLALTLNVLHYRPNAKTIAEQLETALSYAHMLTYRDSLFGYVVHYPDFFEQSDGHTNEPSFSQFTYWGKVEMELTTFILPNDELAYPEGCDRAVLLFFIYQAKHKLKSQTNEQSLAWLYILSLSKRIEKQIIRP